MYRPCPVPVLDVESYAVNWEWGVDASTRPWGSVFIRLVAGVIYGPQSRSNVCAVRRRKLLLLPSKFRVPVKHSLSHSLAFSR